MFNLGDDDEDDDNDEEEDEVTDTGKGKERNRFFMAVVSGPWKMWILSSCL